MNQMETKLKTYIEAGRLEDCKQEFEHILRDSNQTNLWSKVYLHSILKHQPHIEAWLLTIYQSYDIQDQVCLKVTLHYARYVKQYMKNVWIQS